MKRIALFLAALFCFALPLNAMAQDMPLDVQLEGLVTEIVDGGFVIDDVEIGEVLLNVDETTVWDGILIDGEVEVGQYVIVDYDGRLTRSIPPQAHADRVGCYVLNGLVSEFLDNGVLLTGDEVFGDVIVHLSEDMPHVYQGMQMTVYYDGVMALSLPAQAAARYVVVPALTGAVSGMDEEGFTLTDADGNEYRVLLSPDTLVYGQPEERADEQAEEIAGDEPVADTAEVADEAAEDEAVGEPAVEGEEVPAEGEVQPPVRDLPPAPEDWGNGATVTVLYTGAMTRSLPPQLTALEVCVHR